YGFIHMTTPGCLGVDGEGIAPHWRITECPAFDAKGKHMAATRDFERWDGVLFADPEKTESRTQNGYTPYLKEVHTDKQNGGPKRSKRTQNRYIDSNASMSLKEVHNCLPLPLPSKPAIPSSLTDMVLSIVGAELDQLEVRPKAADMPVPVVPCWVFGRRPTSVATKAA